MANKKQKLSSKLKTQPTNKWDRLLTISKRLGTLEKLNDKWKEKNLYKN